MDIFKHDAEVAERLARDIERVDFQYEYPNGLDLHPKTDLHKKTVERIMDRVRASRRSSDPRKTEWREFDWNLSAYVPMSDAEAATKRKDLRKPVTVVVPMTFAAMEVFLTYISGVFFQDPIHRLKGIGGPKAIIEAAKLERVMARQSLWFKEQLHLTTALRDSWVYGVGAVSPVWRKKKATVPMTAEVDEILHGMLHGVVSSAEIGDIIRYAQEKTLFEGTELRNIDPYQLLLDPNVPANSYDDSEFIGYVRRAGIMELLGAEHDPEEMLFNCKYARMQCEQGEGRSAYWCSQSGREERTGGSSPDNTMSPPEKNAVDLIHMYIDIIPDEWGLGDEEYPQKWMFTVAGDTTLIQCQPVDSDYGQFPIVLCAPNTTGYDVWPVSYAATVYPMQQYADWMLTSHATNVRKVMNDMIVVDPTKIHMPDMLNPLPGKIIRTRESAYGQQNLESYIKQLTVTDVTKNNVPEASIFFDFMNHVLGTQDIIAGNTQNQPERPTAVGLQMANQHAMSRLQRIAMIIGEQFITPLSWHMAYNTLQYMGEDVAVPIMGRYEKYLRAEYGVGEEEVWVSPFDLTPNFEVEPHNGVMPGAEDMNAMSTVLQQLMPIDGVGAEIAGRLNLTGMFLQWARKAGFENVHEFINQTGGGVQPQVMPDDQVQQMVQAGDLAPAMGTL